MTIVSYVKLYEDLVVYDVRDHILSLIFLLWIKSKHLYFMCYGINPQLSVTVIFSCHYYIIKIKSITDVMWKYVDICCAGSSISVWHTDVEFEVICQLLHCCLWRFSC